MSNPHNPPPASQPPSPDANAASNARRPATTAAPVVDPTVYTDLSPAGDFSPRSPVEARTTRAANSGTTPATSQRKPASPTRAGGELRAVLQIRGGAGAPPRSPTAAPTLGEEEEETASPSSVFPAPASEPVRTNSKRATTTATTASGKPAVTAAAAASSTAVEDGEPVGQGCLNNPEVSEMAQFAVDGEGPPLSSSDPQQVAHSVSFTKEVNNLPTHLVPLACTIRNLDAGDLAYIADVAETLAMRGVYSLLPYTGSNWFLPSIRECSPGERHWELRYSWSDGLIVALGGRRLSIRLLNILVRVLFIVLTWFMLWNALPHWLVEPRGYVWDPLVLVVVCSIFGGLICRVVQIPPLVGVLWMGVMWNNIPTLHYLTSGIDKHVFDICSKAGLTVILARAGYSLTVQGIRPHWKQSVLLATLPFALEGVTHSLIANKVFEYNNDYNWAFLQGMLCSVVSPAVVVPGTLYLQELGYGRGVGPLSLMLSAVGVEIVIGVWCANFIIGLIFYDQKLAVAIVLGPVQFIGGALIGVGLGFVYHYVVELIKSEAKRMPNGKYAREHFHSSLNFAFFIMLFACFTMVFLGYSLNLAGGGCTMVVFFAATITHIWTTRGNHELETQKKYVGGWLAAAWDNVLLPVLFATMGAKTNVLAIFNADFFPKAIICLVCSTAVRMTVIFVVQLGDGMPWKQKFLVCVGYLGKASAQASVGPIAANLVAAMIAKLPPGEKDSLNTMQRYASNVQQMAALYVMFMAAVASVGLVRGGQNILQWTDPKGPVPPPPERKRHGSHVSRGSRSGSVSSSASSPSSTRSSSRSASTVSRSHLPEDGVEAADGAASGRPPHHHHKHSKHHTKHHHHHPHHNGGNGASHHSVPIGEKQKPSSSSSGALPWAGESGGRKRAEEAVCGGGAGYDSAPVSMTVSFQGVPRTVNSVKSRIPAQSASVPAKEATANGV